MARDPAALDGEHVRLRGRGVADRVRARSAPQGLAATVRSIDTVMSGLRLAGGLATASRTSTEPRWGSIDGAM